MLVTKPNLIVILSLSLISTSALRAETLVVDYSGRPSKAFPETSGVFQFGGGLTTDGDQVGGHTEFTGEGEDGAFVGSGHLKVHQMNNQYGSNGSTPTAGDKVETMIIDSKVKLGIHIPGFESKKGKSYGEEHRLVLDWNFLNMRFFERTTETTPDSSNPDEVQVIGEPPTAPSETTIIKHGIRQVGTSLNIGYEYRNGNYRVRGGEIQRFKVDIETGVATGVVSSPDGLLKETLEYNNALANTLGVSVLMSLKAGDGVVTFAHKHEKITNPDAPKIGDKTHFEEGTISDSYIEYSDYYLPNRNKGVVYARLGYTVSDLSVKNLEGPSINPNDARKGHTTVTVGFTW